MLAFYVAVGKKQGVPVERLLETDSARMLRMEELLAKRIVGFGTSVYLPPAPSVGPMRPAGFPTVEVRRPA